MADLPIPVMAGRRVYDNTPTTVFVLAHNAKRELLVIRRAKQPGYGLLGLPGGYQMRGETWQDVSHGVFLSGNASSNRHIDGG
jgi:hypothetical protein